MRIPAENRNPLPADFQRFEGQIGLTESDRDD
jgi:hypothetical protein